MAGKASIITITNCKGGVGKTTLTTNLASVFAVGLGKRVLIIDMDPQANSTIVLGVEDEAEKTGKKMGNTLLNDWKIPDVRLPSNIAGVDVIAGDRALNGQLDKWSGHAKRFRLVDFIINCPEIDEYDIVLIDTNPSMDCYLQSSLVSSSYYILPVFPENFAFRGIGHFVSSIENIRKYENPSLVFLGLAVTKYDRTNSTHNHFIKKLKEVSDAAKFRLFSTKIPISKAVSAAEAHNTTLNLYKPSNPVAIAYGALAGEILPLLKGRRAHRPCGAVSIPEEEILQDEEVSIEM
jgi:chromosome partitioning protein